MFAADPTSGNPTCLGLLRIDTQASDKHGYRSQSDVRFTLESGHLQCNSRCLLWAKSGHLALFDHLVGAGEQRWRHSKAGPPEGSPWTCLQALRSLPSLAVILIAGFYVMKPEVTELQPSVLPALCRAAVRNIPNRAFELRCLIAENDKGALENAFTRRSSSLGHRCPQW